jgi:hypothetical protein
MEAIYRYQTQLNYVDDGIFPLLSYHHILKEVNNHLFFSEKKTVFYSGFNTSGTSR